MANIKHKSIIKLKDKQFFVLLEQELIKHGMVKVTGLGVFKLMKMKSHTRYIPGSKKVGITKAYVKIVFIPTKTLKVNVQKYNGK